MEEINHSGAVTPIDPSKIRIKPSLASGQTESCGDAALRWFKFGFNVIPIAPAAKIPTVPWDWWLKGLSPEKIANHWSRNPSHELGFIVGDDIIVFDADRPESIAAITALEQKFNVTPNMVVKTSKGEHHYYRRTRGTYAKSDSHSTKQFPERLDVKTGRALVVLPPSTGKTIKVNSANDAGEIVEVGQEFIDAVSKHNGRPPRRFELTDPPAKGELRPHWESSSQTLSWLKALLKHIDPSIGRDDWLRVLMAIFHETRGSEEGFELADTWSSAGDNYQGRHDIETTWISFDPDRENPVTIATLFWMAEKRGIFGEDIFNEVEPNFEECTTEVIYPDEPKAKDQERRPNPLEKYSLRGMAEELRRLATEEVPLLGRVALMGQATAWFAAPNTGKTLIALNLLTESIRLGRVDPSLVFYLNLDDSSSGLADKASIADEYGFHMITDGQKEFNAARFLGIMTEMIEGDHARGVVIILDTAKKFTDLMSKSDVSHFTTVVRQYTKKGGTLLALAHTNKNLGANGKPVPGGTSDLKDDVDCAYTMAPVSSNSGTGEKVVDFENVKKRGNSIQSVSYSYSMKEGISYKELLASVHPVDEEQLVPLKRAEAIKSDAKVIDAITACIKGGVTAKMTIKKAVASTTGVSQATAVAVIEKYTGDDPSVHKWQFSRGDRGVQIFSLLSPASVNSTVDLSGA